MKPIKINLLVQILLAILLGILCGNFFPVWLAQVFQTFNAIFSQFLGFLIPLLIVGFVTPAIAEVGDQAGKVLVVTVALAYLSTTLSGLGAFYFSSALFPSLVTPNSATALENVSGVAVDPYFTIQMPPLMDVMSALILSFIIGIAASRLKAPYIKGFFSELRDIISMTIGKVIIPLLPLYIFGIFLKMTITGEVTPVLSTFARIILIIFGLSIVLLIIQFCIAALFSRKNPFKSLITMLPAYFTALGTQSSAATIPVTLRQTVKMGVSEDIAGFTIPLCATIHMSGSCLKIVCCAVALMLMQGKAIEPGMFIGFICMMGIAMVAAPGVPGGAIMAALGLLASFLGFTEADQALMIALYIAMDSFGTACNVTGDGAISQIVDRFFGNHLNPIPKEARM
ncbi:MAG: dicarboxylate/amino acid:cation symporter [Bacteroides sp.]|nr:dicarboxylate/amino acid:cation symporter [Bacteroides sp.]